MRSHSSHSPHRKRTATSINMSDNTSLECRAEKGKVEGERAECSSHIQLGNIVKYIMV